MNLNHRCDLAARIVEATIREFHGRFRKGKSLERFYRSIRRGRARAFVALRDDPEDFVGLCFDATGRQIKFELWLNLENHDDGPPWCASMYRRFRASGVQYTHRSPRDPAALVRSMRLLGDANECA